MNITTISTESIDSLQVIYIRFKGTYLEFRRNSRKMFNKLFDYVKSNNLIIEDFTKVLTIYHDNPFITEAKNLRTSVAITVPSEFTLENHDEITSLFINGKYLVGTFEISPNEYGKAWDYMYNEILFKSNYVPRDTFPFEMYVTEPPKNSKSKSNTKIYIPIE